MKVYRIVKVETTEPTPVVEYTDPQTARRRCDEMNVQALGAPYFYDVEVYDVQEDETPVQCEEERLNAAARRLGR